MTAMTTTQMVAKNGQRRPSHYCSTCGRRADTVHLVDRLTGGYPESTDLAVRFACPRHDYGGYWIPIDQYDLDRGGWLDHLAAKDWRGDLALVRAGLA